MPRFEPVTHHTCPDCKMCVSGYDNDSIWHLANQINGEVIDDLTTVDHGKIQCACGAAMNVAESFVCGACGSDSDTGGECLCNLGG